jgi:hypothetical protein
MARPRKYIQSTGKTINGVHHHRASGRYYVLDHQGGQVYFRDWREASATRQSCLGEQLDPADRAKLEA